MGSLAETSELSKALIEAGNNLLKSHSSTNALLCLLHEIETLLSTLEQGLTVSVKNALIPSVKALVSANLLRNPDSDVRVFVVSCLTQIMRITAPDAPYNDDQMKEIFQVTIEAFGKLVDASCRSYEKAEVVLETVSMMRSSLIMLDLDCDNLILEMFSLFLKIISPTHSQSVFTSMETIMVTIIDESEEVSLDLLDILLTAVKKESHDVSPTASKLVERVFSSCARKLQPCIMKALKLKGTSLDMYSPVVSSICQTESVITQAPSVVNIKENEADEQILEKPVVADDSLEDKVELRLSRKGNRSTRSARGETHQTDRDDKERIENDLKQLLKQGQSESRDAEAESGSTGKRGRKPNSLMNPEEGYSFKLSSSNKIQKNGNTLLGKATKVGQKNQSVVISPSSSSKARTWPHTRSRTKMDGTNNDACSIANSTLKKHVVTKDNLQEEDVIESNLEKSEDGIKTAESGKKERAQSGLVKTSANKLVSETKMVKTSGKKSVRSDAKKKNSEGASMNTSITRSSNRKKNSSATTTSNKKSEQTPNRKQTVEKEVESDTNEFGDELVGKKVNVWWPLDKMFYEGIIDSYCARKKMHRVRYSDGEVEELNLKKERFDIIHDHSPASEDMEIDLPESIPLSDLIQMQKVKKRKNMSTNVEPSSSPEVGSSVRATKKKDSVTDLTKQAKRTKCVSNLLESREGENLATLKELNGDEPSKTKGRTDKTQKVTLTMHQESEKDCDEKEETETKSENNLKLRKSNAEPNCMEEHQELLENQNAETKIDGEEQKFEKEPSAGSESDGKECNSLKEPNAELQTDGEETKKPTEQKVVKEPTAEPKTDNEVLMVAKETNVEPKANEEVKKSLEETNVELRIEGEEQISVKKSDVEPETKVEDSISIKEQSAADTKFESGDM